MSDDSAPNPYASGSHAHPIQDQTEGKLYQVVEPDGSETWGHSLTWSEAHVLKERVCGRRMSTRATIIPMNQVGRLVDAKSGREIPYACVNNQVAVISLQQAQDAALAAGRGEAQRAQERADAKRAAAAVAARLKAAADEKLVVEEGLDDADISDLIDGGGALDLGDIDFGGADEP